MMTEPMTETQLHDAERWHADVAGMVFSEPDSEDWLRAHRKVWAAELAMYARLLSEVKRMRSELAFIEPLARENCPPLVMTPDGAPRWTAERPTQEGKPYWAQTKLGDVSMVEVQSVDPLRVSHFNGWEPADCSCYIEWAGPIPEPKP